MYNRGISNLKGFIFQQRGDFEKMKLDIFRIIENCNTAELE